MILYVDTGGYGKEKVNIVVTCVTIQEEKWCNSSYVCESTYKYNIGGNLQYFTIRAHKNYGTMEYDE